jgi:methionyl-tRNA synthetase
MSRYYITTSIAYVNAVPHIGFALELIRADALARFNRQSGNEVLFSTGTDEHGGKNAEAAKKLGLTPGQFVDELSQNYIDLCSILDISYDRFIRTTSKQHQDGVQAIWRQLSKYIYKAQYQGMYDQKEEEFITLDDARKIKKQNPERYKRLEPIEEENYFFKLSEFTQPVLSAIKNGSYRIVPAIRKNEILALLKDGLEDISVSRPRKKLDWGVPVPDDKDHVVYVWFEALMNYITVLGYPDGEDFENYWPVNVHVVGKDITRFHAAIWPGVLLALNLPLPKELYVHGFVTTNGQKMSKSVGNVISPLEIVADYGSDAMRYYFLRHISSYDDGDFSWDKLESSYNGELGNELGNLVQRIASMIKRYQDGVIGDIPSSEHDTVPYSSALADYRFDKSLDYIFGLIRGLNRYIDQEKPWEIAKEKESGHLQEVLAYSVSTLLQIADMLGPFLPKTSQRIIEMFAEGVIKDTDTQLFPRKELLK